MGTTCFLLLSCLGLAIIAQAQDCPKPVGGPNMNLKDILLQTFPDGSQVSFACDTGYAPAGGSPVIFCNAGTWSPVMLRCERKSCGSAGEVENGQIDYSNGNEFGDKIVITCNPGYRLVGKSEITCGDQGWLGRLPVCEVVSCDPPPTVQDGTFSPIKDVYAYGEVVQYSCQKDFTLNGSKSISCSEGGTFQPVPPTCIMVQCQDPDIENADWIEGARPPYGYKATVTYKCRTGYKMEGAPTFTCELNGKWSPAEPICKVVTCGPPPKVANGTFSPDKESYKYREVVEYSCQKDFTLRGTKSVSCSADGTFKSAPPTCIKMPTPTKPSTPTTTTTTTTTTTETPTDIQCKDPDIENADRIEGSQPPYRYKDTVTYQCRSGYKMTGERTLICNISSQWSPGIPKCERSDGNSVIGWVCGIAAALLCAIAGYCGYQQCKKKKGNGDPDKKATKSEEEMNLSNREGQDKNPADIDQEAGSPLEKSAVNEQE